MRSIVLGADAVGKALVCTRDGVCAPA